MAADHVAVIGAEEDRRVVGRVVHRSPGLWHVVGHVGPPKGKEHQERLAVGIGAAAVITKHAGRLIREDKRFGCLGGSDTLGLLAGELLPPPDDDPAFRRAFASAPALPYACVR